MAGFLQQTLFLSDSFPPAAPESAFKAQRGASSSTQVDSVQVK